MNTTPLQREPIDLIAEEFVARYRRGERPSLTELCEQHPALADDIRELIPALVMMEMAGAEVTSSSARAQPESGTLPRQLGDYRVLREVGRGGMGIVYEAEQVSLGRHVALKVLPCQFLMDSSQLKRFHREAQAVARLHHSNIVPVFGIGEHEGVHYYAMQFIQGRGLDEILIEVRGLQAPAEADVVLGQSDASQGSTDQSYFQSVARIGLQVAEALAYAHEQGVLHRDIKPSNLLLDKQGTVWITDFGLAKADGNEDLTHTGDMIGTLRYMAPERFKGWSDPRSDLYGLGLTLYELLTLRPAFDETQRAKLIRQVALDEPPHPCKLNRSIPRDLETIVLKASAKEPGQRYASARELAEDLRRFLGGKPIEARRASLRERSWLWCRRNPLAATLGTLVVALLVVSALGASLAALKLHREKQLALEHLERAAEAEHAAVEAERLAQRRLYDALLNQARASRHSPRAGSRFEALEAIRSAAELVRPLKLGAADVRELRNEAIGALTLVDLRLAEQWPDHPPADAHVRVAFDADLERYATLDPGGEVVIRRVSDNHELVRLPGMGDVNDHRPCLRFSPDGRLLAVKGTAAKRSTHTNVAVWDIATRTPVLQAAGRGQWYDLALDFTPDSRKLALGVERGAIALYDLAAAGEAQRFGSGRWPYCLRFDTAGKRLAVVRDGVVEIVDVQSGAVLRQLEHPMLVPCVAWGADRLLAAACEDRQIYVWDAETGQRETLCSGHRAEVRQVTFNHRGDLLASSGWDATMRLWDPLTGRQLVTSSGCPIRFSRDDEWLAQGLAGASIGRWKVAAGGHCRIIPAHGETRHVAVALSPDGRFLATASLGGASLWDCATGRNLKVFSSDAFYSVLFHPSDNTIYLGGIAGVQQVAFDLDQGIPDVGPAKTLLRRPVYRVAIAAKTATLAATLRDYPAAVVLPADHPEPSRWLKPHNGMRFIAISPDDRWVVTGPWNSGGVCIWDASSGRLKRQLTVPRTASVKFSPDGHWLVINSFGQCQFVRTADWQEGWHAATKAGYLGDASFTADGRVVAVATSAHMVRLFDTSSSQELARFESPAEETMYQVSLSADGSHLAVGTTQGTVIVWNLRQIRADLAELGLD